MIQEYWGETLRELGQVSERDAGGRSEGSGAAGHGAAENRGQR